MVLQVIPSGGGAAAADGISIPQTNLANFGVTAPEMTNDANGLARAVLGILRAIQAEDLNAVLGLSHPANPTFTAPTVSVLNWTYSLTQQVLANKKTNEISSIPLPTVGNNNGIGGIALTDIFANAAVVNNTDAIGAAALVIPTADIATFNNGIVHGNLNLASGQDNRDIVAAIYQNFAFNLNLRSAQIASAVIARSVSALTGVGVPAALTAATNPTSGINADDVTGGNVILLTQTHSVTIQTAINITNDTTDVRVVTA